ncbi:AAA family ATPase [Streptomyces sp. NPDC056580]|uniref:AAA family ATPase n=1 Tax=Streptomyces sp. NPDC056580 TaxID=3345872 RepID=UPI0036936EDE
MRGRRQQRQAARAAGVVGRAARSALWRRRLRPEINPPHPDLQRADGTSIYRPIGSATFTTRSLRAAGNRLWRTPEPPRPVLPRGDSPRRRPPAARPHLHSWLHQRTRLPDGKQGGEAFRLRPGDVVLVDEAGMAGTLLLDRVLTDAASAGAVVRLLGDPHPFAAVEAGGALRLISRAGPAVELDQLHASASPARPTLL